MAAFMLESTNVTVNSVSYQGDLKSAVLTLDRAVLDTTDFGSAGWTEAIKGLRSGTLQLTFNDDVDDNAVDEELYALWTADSVHAVLFKPVAGTTGASIPEYQFNVNVTEYQIGGSVGDLAAKTLTWPITGAVVRDITP